MEIKLITSSEVLDVRDGTHDSPKYVNNGYPLITSKNLKNGKICFEDVSYITEEDYININKRSNVDLGDILYSMIGSIGNYAIVTEEPLFAIKNVALFKFKDERLYNRYFYFLLNSQFVENQIKSQQKGGTQKFVTLKILRNLKIPLPPLETQKKIAVILDEADKLRQLDKQLIEKYDALTQSLFLDMFGDPVTNPKGWENRFMNEICSKVTDGTHDTPKRLKKGVKFITGKHIKPFSIDYENSDYVSEEVHNEIYRRCNPELGDVLYTNIGVNLGTAALNVVDYEFSMKNVALLKGKKNIIIGRFLEYYLNSKNMKEKIIWISSIGGAQKFLSLTELRKLSVLIPPIDLQNQFAERVEAIEAQKALAQQSLEKSEELFNSLLQKAFKGELV